MWEYSEKVLDHYRNPRNVGSIENADMIGEAGSLTCGDSLKLFIKLDGKKIVDAKFQTFGCGSAVASSSILTEMIIGKTLDEVKKITNKDIAEQLGGLPQQKMHCSVMGREALEDALKKYYGEDSNEWQEIEIAKDDTNDADRIVCHCFNVTEGQIIEAIKVNKLSTVEEVTNYTKAGGACGRCKGDIQAILDKYLKENNQKKELTPTQKIIKINSLLETKIAPQLKIDGGNIELVEVDGNKVVIKLVGMCAGCTNSKATIENFIAKTLKEEIDENIVVENV